MKLAKIVYFFCILSLCASCTMTQRKVKKSRSMKELNVEPLEANCKLLGIVKSANDLDSQRLSELDCMDKALKLNGNHIFFHDRLQVVNQHQIKGKVYNCIDDSTHKKNSYWKNSQENDGKLFYNSKGKLILIE